MFYIIVFMVITLLCVIFPISHFPARKAPPDVIEEIKRSGLITLQTRIMQLTFYVISI